jgi:glycosyltransferase involved in cell wall biosynthesis
MTLGIFSTQTGMPWGGSEQLWSRAAMRLLERGHEIAVNYKKWPTTADPLEKIRRHGGALTLRSEDTAWARLQSLVHSALRRRGIPTHRHRLWLESTRPDVVLVSSGWHEDDLSITRTCRQLGIPYAILLHCTSYHDWIGNEKAERIRTAYQEAQKCFFVSDENRDIIETLTAASLGHPEIVDNPINVDPGAAPPWPAVNDVWHLACVGRLHCRSKGQDLIVKVLRRSRWRDRPLHVTLYGQNQDSKERLHRLIDKHDVQDQMTIAGYTSLNTIWRENHALLLPSRFEGMPMVTLEAMLWERPAIVTNCGRNGEFVDDGETGFLVPAATTELLDQAMERAWRHRHEWQTMGTEAARRIRSRYSDHPVEDFADRLESLAAAS